MLAKKNSVLISVIIANCNGRSDLEKCISSILRFGKLPLEIIVVDNKSHDDSLNYLIKLESKIDNLIIIKNKINTGFAEGNNIGYQKAKGKYILFLNNDAFITQNSLQVLVKTLAKDKFLAAVQPIIMQYPQTTLVDSIGSYFVKSGFLYHRGHNKPLSLKDKNQNLIFTMKGACMLIKKEVLDEVGVFDKDFFAYFEETDLCHRIWLAGYKIAFEPNSIIFHKGGQTSNKLALKFITFHSYKNRIQSYLKNFEIISLARILPIHIFMCLLVSFLYILTFKFSLGLAVFKGILWNISNFNIILKKRLIIQEKIRKVPDSYYLKKITRSVRPNYYYHLFTTSLRGYIDA